MGKAFPPVCPSCYDVLSELYRLHEQLLNIQWLIQKQTELAREIVKKAVTATPAEHGSSSQEESLSECQFYVSSFKSSGMSAEETTPVLKLVDNLHDKIIATAGKEKVIYPARVPPNFTPAASAVAQLQASHFQSSVFQPIIPITVDRGTPLISSVYSVNATATRTTLNTRALSISEGGVSSGSTSFEESTSKRMKSNQAEVILLSSDDEEDNAEKSDETEQETRDQEKKMKFKMMEDEDDAANSMESESAENGDAEEDQDEDVRKLSPVNSQPSSSSGSIDIVPTTPALPPQLTSAASSLGSFSFQVIAPNLTQSFIIVPGATPSIQQTTMATTTTVRKPKRIVKKEGIRRRRRRGDPTIIRGPTTIRRFVNGISTVQNCDLCAKLIPLPNFLEHLKSHVKNYIVSCPSAKCPYLFSCTGKLAKHLKISKKCGKAANIPPGLASKICEICDYETKDPHNFRKHLHDHERSIPDKLLCCPIPQCLERYALRQSVDDHIFTHDLKEPMSEQGCSVCQTQIPTQELINHLKEAHQVSTPLSCKRCPTILHNWESLLDHYSDHRGRGGISCDICSTGVKYHTYDLLCQHYFNAHNIGTQFSCEYCSRQLYSLQGLSHHVKSKHSKTASDKAEAPSSSVSKKTLTLLKCERCPDMSFNTEDAQITHNIKVHDAPPLPCPSCSKTFMSPSGLREHEKLHSGLARTFNCEVENCSKSFTTRSALTVHVDRIHLGKLPPKCVCEECGEIFSCETTLKTHKLIHTGDRPHSCPICKQAFRTRGVMRTHMKGHEKKGKDFVPNGPMKGIRKRVVKNE